MNIFSLWESRAFRPGEGHAVCELFRFSTRLKSPTRTLPDRHPPVANSFFPLPEGSFLTFDPPEEGCFFSHREVMLVARTPRVMLPPDLGFEMRSSHLSAFQNP